MQKKYEAVVSSKKLSWQLAVLSGLLYQKAPLENPPGGTLRPPLPPVSTIGP